MLFSPQILIRRPPKLVVAGAAPFALDGTPVTANSGGTTALVLPAFSTTYASVICVAVTSNAGGASSMTSANLTFARQPGLTPPQAGGSTLDFYYAVAAAPLSSEVITVNQSGASFITALVFAVSGAKNSAPFDVNVAIPNAQNNTGITATITTTASDVFGFGIDVDNTSTPASGFTDMNATSRGNFLQLDYKISSTGFLAQSFSSNATQSGSLATAIVKGP